MKFIKFVKSENGKKFKNKFLSIKFKKYEMKIFIARK